MAVRKGLILAMEEENPEVVEVPEETEINQITNNANNDEYENDYSLEDIDDFSSKIEEADNDVDSLLDIKDVINNNEDFNTVAAEMASVIIKNISYRLGIEDNDITKYENKDEAKKETNDKADGIIKRAWEAIKNAFKFLWNKVVDFLYKIFNQVERLKKDISSAETYVKNKIEGKKPGGIITSPKTWLMFCCGVHSNTETVSLKSVGVVFKNINTALDAGNHLSQEYTKYYDDIGDFLMKINDVKFWDFENKKIAKVDFLREFASKVRRMQGFTKDINFMLTNGTGIIYEKLEIANGINHVYSNIEYEDVEAKNSFADMIDASYFTINTGRMTFLDNGKGDKVECLDQSQIISILTNVADTVLRSLDKFKKNDPKKMNAKFNSLIDQAIKYSDLTENSKEKEIIRSTLKLQKAIVSRTARSEIAVISQIPKHAITFIHGCINYALESAKAYT